MSRLWPFLAPEERDAAGIPAVLLPPSPPPPARLALLFEFLRCDKKHIQRWAKAAMHTQRPPGISRVAFSVRGAHFGICKKPAEGKIKTSADSVNNLLFGTNENISLT